MYALICTLRPLHQGFCIQEFSNTAFQVAPGFEWAEVESEVDTHEFCGVEVEGTWTIQPIARPDLSLAQAEAIIQDTLNTKALEWGYTSAPGVGSILSATTYLGSTNLKYRAEAEALAFWRDEVWSWAEARFASGNFTTKDALLQEIPEAPVRP